MPNIDVGTTTTSSLDGNITDVTVDSQTPDSTGAQSQKITWQFPDANQQLGYYNSIPELKSALHVLAQRVCGLGYETDSVTSLILEGIRGYGKDTFSSIMMQLVIEKKVFGDSFAEIIRKDGQVINLKKLYTGDMTIVLDPKGIITGYEQKSNIPGGEPRKFSPEQIFHLVNDRMANEIHGTSVIDSLKTIINAKNEALTDEKKIRHRELALGIIRVDTNNSAKQTAVKTAHKDAINNGEAMVVGDGVEILNSPNQPRDRIQWLQYLDNLFYQVIGTPKVLVTSEGYTEAGGKAGLLAFEPVELAEKLQVEEEFRLQIGRNVRFKRAPSLLDTTAQTESKNAGQTGIQKNETKVSANRTE